MTLDEYQKAALRTASEDGGAINLAVLGLGLAGESGEVADLLKKHIGHRHPLDKAELANELGDVLWYVSVLADAMGLGLSAIAEANIAKLKRRYPDGFSPEASRNRKEG